MWMSHLPQLSRFVRNAGGAAAVEFAQVLPLLLLMFAGAVEFSMAIAVDRRVSQVAGATGDLVARADRSIRADEVVDIMNIGGFLLAPANIDSLTITIRNVMSSPTDANDTRETWVCTYAGLSRSTSCNCSNETYTLPREGLVGVNDSVIVASAAYSYRPVGLSYVLDEGIYAMGETRFFKPRTQSARLRMSETTVC